MQNAESSRVRPRCALLARLVVVKRWRLVLLLCLIGLLIHLVHLTRYVIFDRVERAEMYLFDFESERGPDGAASRRATVFCMILTAPKNLATKARAVNLTWARQCDDYRFVTVIPDNLTQSGLPLLQPEGHAREHYDDLTSKVYLSFKHVHKHLAGFDWYLKADDDTYFFVENLRAFLRGKNPDASLYYGHKFQFFLSSYHSGGAGYVLSAGALDRLGARLARDDHGCPNTGVEDQDIAACLRKSNVYPKPADDPETGLPLFNYYKLKPGQFESNRIHTFSKSTISLHYLTVDQMFTIDSLWKTHKREMFSTD